jgi:AraC-like DNA-binding protein
LRSDQKMDAPAFITVRPAAALLLWASAEGVDITTLRGPLDPALLADPDARIPLFSYYDLLERAAHLMGGPDVGLRFCQFVDTRKWERANLLQTASATVGEGLERTMRYMTVWNSHEHIRLERRGREAALLYRPFGPPRLAHRIKAEMTLADMISGGRRYVAREDGLHLVRFTHERPASTALHEAVFRAPVEFGAHVDEAIFDAALLDVPIATANADALEFVERQLRAQLAARPRRFVDRARELLLESLPGEHTLAALARRMGLPPRTLQRHLAAEGMTLQRLLDDTRRELALRHLGNRTAIAETAFLLGFSEPSAFHRAFKRWTGTTPQAWLAR